MDPIVFRGPGKYLPLEEEHPELANNQHSSQGSGGYGITIQDCVWHTLTKKYKNIKKAPNDKSHYDILIGTQEVEIRLISKNNTAYLGYTSTSKRNGSPKRKGLNWIHKAKILAKTNGGYIFCTYRGNGKNAPLKLVYVSAKWLLTKFAGIYKGGEIKIDKIFNYNSKNYITDFIEYKGISV